MPLRHLPAVFLIAACGPSAPPLTAVPYQPDSGNLFVRCGSLIDGLADEAASDRIVVIRNGRIVMVGGGDAELRPGLTVLDLRDYTCLPGLINTHVHLADRPEYSSDYTIYYRLTLSDFTQLALANAQTTLGTGFTTVRNVGDYYPDAVYAAREQIESGSAIGPRIRTAGPYLTIPRGGGDLYITGHDESEIPAAARKGVASSPGEFAEKAQQAIDEGADFLKVIASGAVFSFGGVPGAPEMSLEEIEAVVVVAQAAGLRVTAHVHSAQSGKDAILAGVDALEHASLLDDEAIALAKEYDVALSMDVYNGTYTEEVGLEQGYPEEFMRKNFETTEAQRIVFEKAFELGVPILYGTDAGVLPHDMGGWQFGIMVERGMTPMDAIRSASSVAAEHMDMADDVGAIEAGRYGDLIAVRGDPLANVGLLKDVDVVVKGGLVFKLPE